MTRARFKKLTDRIRVKLPAPMAAPETAHLRGKRLRFVVLLAVLAAVTAIWASLAAISQFGAALLWLGLAMATVLQGVTWLITKQRADNAWLDEERHP